MNESRRAGKMFDPGEKTELKDTGMPPCQNTDDPNSLRRLS